MTPSPFKDNILAGKVALITGGSSGIGFEIGRQLGLHGAKLVICGRRQEVLDQAAALLRKDGITVMPLQGDVRKDTGCDKWVTDTVAKWGRLDILVNCAAGNFLATAEELSTNGFRTVMEIDTIGAFSMSKAAFPELRKSPSGGSIINISATLQYGATWYQVHASAAKAALDSMTRTLALEWGQFNVRVNGIAPGPIAGTAGMAKLAPLGEEKMQALMCEQIPLGRMGEKWDIAMAAVFLASPAASYMTGDTMVVDGAAWMWKPQVIPRSSVSTASRGVEGHSRSKM